MSFFLKSEYKIHYFLLTTLVILSHFFPFDRASLAPDDYSLMNRKFNFFLNFLIYSDRPLQYFFLDLKYFILNQNTLFYNIFLLLINCVNCLVVYILLLLFFSKNNSFLISLIYILLYNKLEIYHNAIMIHIIVVSTLYILSLYFLISYFLKLKKIFLFFSIFLYCVSIFWYEIGFFLPLIVFFINKKTIKFYDRLKIIFPYLLLMLFYLSFRISPFLGISDLEVTHTVNSNYFYGFYDLFNHYFGRYMIKNLIYGMYVFFSSNIILIFFILFLNFTFIFYLFKNFKIDKINYSYFFFFLVLFILSVIPLIINGESGGRNLIISSISFSCFIFFFLTNFIKNIKIVYTIIFFFGLIISQGNNFSQIKASIIQKDILLSIDKNKDKIKEVRYLIFNTKSLMENINYSFVDNNYNLINTYYGAQVWEIWGIRDYLKQATNKQIKLIVTNQNPVYSDNLIKINKVNSYNNKILKTDIINLNKTDVFILDYNKIYNIK